jgi:hypothetical protein
LKTERADERYCVSAHLLDGGRHRTAGRSDAPVVERDDAMVGSQTVDHAWIPVVEDGRQVMQEHHRNG